MTSRDRWVGLLLSTTWWLPAYLVAQETPSDSAQVFKNAIHLGFGGTSSIVSINYERVLLKKKDLGVSARIGLGSIHLNDFTRRFNPDLLVPLGVYATYGGGWMAEIGAGGTYTSIVYPDENTFEPARRPDFHAWCSIGLRVRTGDRLWLRAAFTPIFEFGRTTRAFEFGIGCRF